jgi:hypothetical protein
LEEVKKAGRQLAIPAAYAEHYWRKKQEGQTAWFDKQNRKRLINWPQQLENWWIEDREKPQWQEKNGAAATVVDLEAALHREKDPERRRQLKEQIERSK